MTGKYIDFIELPPAAKTRRWEVRAKQDGYFLGIISWFARWYQYSFFPNGNNTVFEKTCLRDIADFCEAQTKIHRGSWGRK